MYGSYSSISNPTTKQRQIYKLLPLFCTNCAKYKGQALVTKFPEVYEFAADVAKVFVAHVRLAAQASNMARYGSVCQGRFFVMTSFRGISSVKSHTTSMNIIIAYADTCGTISMHIIIAHTLIHVALPVCISL